MACQRKFSACEICSWHHLNSESVAAAAVRGAGGSLVCRGEGESARQVGSGRCGPGGDCCAGRGQQGGTDAAKAAHSGASQPHGQPGPGAAGHHGAQASCRLQGLGLAVRTVAGPLLPCCSPPRNVMGRAASSHWLEAQQCQAWISMHGLVISTSLHAAPLWMGWASNSHRYLSCFIDCHPLP